MTRVLLIVIALILYGSLFPWTFRPAPPGVTPFAILLHSWPAVIPPSSYPDILVNILLYMPVGLFGFLAFDRHRRRWLRWIAPVLVSLLLSGCIELLQVYDVSRDCSLLDVFDNTLGGALGIILGYLYRGSMSDSILLVLLWLGFQVFLLFRRIMHLPTLANRLDQFASVVAWGVVLYLLAMPAEPVRKSRFASALAIGFTSLVVVRELAPFHWVSSATQFSWVPFYQVLNSQWIDGLPVFLQKSFFYGGAIWLLRYSGWSLLRSTALVTVLLSISEALQTHLPGRTPEITDPFMAILFGCVLWLVEQDYILRVQT